MRDVVYIELVFENVEALRIKPGGFYYIQFKDVEHLVYRMNKSASDSRISMDITLRLAKDVWKQSELLDYTNMHEPELPEEEMQTLLQHHLGSRGDITSIDIVYEDGEVKTYDVPWEETNEWGVSNRLQQLDTGQEEYDTLTIRGPESEED